MDKLLKDPVYGYITVDKEIIDKIIDDSAFQRLRHIGQTSYTPLYSAALHNRFIHSLGVYHLGKIVSKSLIKSVEKDGDKNSSDFITSLKKTFELACLLHDIGHSPFSHTGENFYLKENGAENEPLYNNLKGVIKNPDFSKDFEDARIKRTLGKPHEIMSAFLGIKLYVELIDDSDFFARCIIGLLYQDDSSYEAQIKNSFIKLLNSSCIDVDKIDYLLRDAYVTGFDTISIDYVRLLKSVVIKKYKCENDDATSTERYKLSFNKRAVSVLENVVYAHDSERKWIQNHPVVLYESFIIKHAIESVLDYYKRQNLDIFSYEALLEQGITNESGKKVSLICDDDFIYAMKNCISDNLIYEYFNRKMRRHPVWKSEAEYMAFFGKKGEWTLKFNKTMSYLEKFLTEEAKAVVDDNVIGLLNEKIELIKSKDISEADKTVQLERYEKILGIVNKLKKIAEEMELEYNFVIIKSGVFSSGFSKRAIKEVLVDFPNCNKEVTLESVTTLLDAEEKENKNFYYIFYKRNKPMDSSFFAKNVYNLFNDEL